MLMTVCVAQRQKPSLLPLYNPLCLPACLYIVGPNKLLLNERVYLLKENFPSTTVKIFKTGPKTCKCRIFATLGINGDTFFSLP